MSASPLKQLSSWKVMGGYVKKFMHQSSSTKTEMRFNIFFPPSLTNAAASTTKVPAVYWSSRTRRPHPSLRLSRGFGAACACSGGRLADFRSFGLAAPFVSSCLL